MKRVNPEPGSRASICGRTSAQRILSRPNPAAAVTNKCMGPAFHQMPLLALLYARNAGEYGRVTEQHDRDDALDWTHTQRQCLPGGDLPALEAQERLQRLSINSRKQAMSEIPSGNSTAPRFTSSPGHT
ncbi:hypothetical protein F5B17DRAFT_453693 [Nemania serpens]|nr:hypothetical protein F5B17DRAFT_453693 [Nemania serpens]